MKYEREVKCPKCGAFNWVPYEVRELLRVEVSRGFTIQQIVNNLEDFFVNMQGQIEFDKVKNQISNLLKSDNNNPNDWITIECCNKQEEFHEFDVHTQTHMTRLK